ncbi:benzoate 4-monooxygenase cytochrome P450 [Cadophora sp. DSE1049]|nr:benzoate 4-monooxygenase cytochrome P450 [Cadophora sp. DSE1049]
MLKVSLWLLAAPPTFLFLYFIAKPVVVYFYDEKDLRKYPNQNPFSGITNLAPVWERVRGFRTRHLYEQHKTQPIIRLGPNSLSFADIRAIKDIYGHNTPCRKDDQYSVAAGAHFNLLDVVDKNDHARKRKLLSNAFATRNLEAWEFKVSDKVEKMMVQFDKRCTAPLPKGQLPRPEELTVNFRKWSNLFTVDAIADIALSETLGLLGSADDTLLIDNHDGTKEKLNFVESLHGGNRATSLIIWSTDWYHITKPLTSILSGYFKKQWQHGRNYSKIVGHLVQRRLHKHLVGEPLDDFLACLLQDKQGLPRSLPRGEIEAEVNVMTIVVNAGSDTTAIALTHALYYLIKNPCALVKLRDEVASTMSDKDGIAKYVDVKNLPYLRACLDESLRISPPVSFGLVRQTPPGGMEILGKYISGNTVVSLPAYVAHRDPVMFPNPEEYRPERWLEDEDKAKKMHTYFIPFSTGARGCIGRNISYLEQQVLIATLVHRYDFALPTNDWELKWEEAFNLWPNQLPLKVWRREHGATALVQS